MSEYLNTLEIEVTDSQRDGRINSILHEDKLTELLAKKYPIDVPEARAWYDFSVTHNGIFYPVNIKSTTGKGNDNLSCKLGIYYALTGIKPTFANEIGWEKFFKRLEEDIKKNNRDYYFMVLNKKLSEASGFAETEIHALKGLQSLVPNGNNLPFQCIWTETVSYTHLTLPTILLV